MALFLLGGSEVSGQNYSIPYSGTDSYFRKLLASPVQAEKFQQLENQIYNFMRSHWQVRRSKNLLIPKTNATYTLPVVVHIIHNNGPENIPDAQVHNAIKLLNQAFRNQGWYNQGLGNDTEIEFCLAVRDPQGFPTSGINRVVSNLTTLNMENQDIALKNLSRWNPLKYINIWVVKEICSTGELGCSIAGYATRAISHGSAKDGIVIEYRYFGKSFSALPDEAVTNVLVREMGNYLNLFHTFEGRGMPNVCQNNDCLANGDRVCDTPPDSTILSVANCNDLQNSCSTDANDPSTSNPFTTDVPDDHHNFMDYNNLLCQHRFSEGQKLRMHYTIANIRNSLLHSLACKPRSAIDAALTEIISPQENNFCQATITPAVKLTNLGTTTLNNVQIQATIDNDLVYSTTWEPPLNPLESTVINFPPISNLRSGMHSIEFEVISPGTGIDEEITNNKIWVVFFSINNPTTHFCENFQNNASPEDDLGIYSHPYTNPNLEDFRWQLAGTDSFACHFQILYLDSFGKLLNNEEPYDDIILPAIDLTNATQAKLKFDIAYRRGVGTNNMRLQVLATNNCGQNLSAIYDKTGAVLSTVSDPPGANLWMPTSCNDWRTETIDLAPYLGQIVYLTLRAIAQGNTAPNLYIDNICLEITRPNILIAQVNFTQACGGDVLALPYSSNTTFLEGNIFRAELSDPDGNFTTPQVIGTLGSTQSNGSIPITLPENLAAGSNYKIRIVSTSPNIVGAASAQSFSVLPPLDISIHAPSTACLGQPVSIVAFPAIANATYTWQCDGCSPSLLPTPGEHVTTWNTVGEKTIRLTLQPPNGCKTKVQTSITISLPPALAIQAPHKACTSQPVLVSVNNLGPSIIYAWECNNCTPSNLLGSGPHTISWSTVGVKTINVQANQNGCISQASFQVTVNLPPALSLSLSNSNPCNKEWVTLSVSGAPANSIFTWECQGCFPPPNSTVGPFEISWLTAGTRILSVSADYEGCISTHSMAFTVKQAPEPIFGIGTSEICAGNTTLIQALEGPAGAQYSWNCDNCIVPPAPNIGPHAVGWQSSGTKTISLTMSYNGCNVTTSQTITVIPPYGSPSIAPLTVCQNGIDSIVVPFNTASTISQIQLYASAQSTTPLGALIAPIHSPAKLAIPPVQHSTTFYVQIHPQIGCPSLFIPVAVNVQGQGQIPSISGKTAICQGSTLMLTASGVQNATYQWQKAGTPPAYFSGNTLIKPNVMLHDSGTYTVLAWQNGCTTAKSVSVSIVANNMIPAFQANTPVCQGDTLKLIASMPPGVNFSWKGPNNFSRTTTQNHIFLANVSLQDSGFYSLTTFIAGCTSLTGQRKISVLPRPPMPMQVSNTSPVCAGSNVQFIASAAPFPGAQYYWKGPDGFSTLLNANDTSFIRPAVQTQQAGIYSVALVANGCTSQQWATTSVVVYPIPPQPTPTSNSPICTTPALLLTAPSFPNATYLWKGPNNFAATTHNLSLVRTNLTFQDSGLYSLQVVVNGCTSQVGTTHVIITDILPPPIISSNAPICVGTTLQLSAPPNVNNPIYHWNGPSNFSATTNIPSLVLNNVTLSNAGTYSLLYTFSGCTSAVGEISVAISDSIPPPPVASLSSPVCEGQNLSIFINSPGVYKITGPNQYRVQGEQQVFVRNSVTSQDAGIYSIQTWYAGCLSEPTQINAIIHVPPTASIQPLMPICQGRDVELKAQNIHPFATYTWIGLNGFNVNGTRAIITNVSSLQSGIYTLEVKVPGCPPATATATLEVIDPPRPTLSFPSFVCAGDNLEIAVTNPTPNTLYHWQGPQGFQLSSYSPILNRANMRIEWGGIYTVTAIMQGCSSPRTATDNIDIRFIQPPTLELVDLNQQPISKICENESFSLKIKNHSLQPSDVHYLWQVPHPLIPSTTGPALEVIAALPVFSGTYAVRAASQGCTSAIRTYNLTVHPMPALPTIYTNSPLCQGQGRMFLEALPTPGAAYFYWQGPHGFTTTINPLIRESQLDFAGTYSVVAISTQGCSSQVQTASFTIYPTPLSPTLQTNSPVCENEALILTVNSSAGATFYIQGPNGYLAQGSQTQFIRANVNPAAAGTYNAVAVLGNCSTAATSTRVSIIPLPARPSAYNSSPQCQGGSVRLWINPVTPGVSYYWQGPNNFTATGSYITLENISLSQIGIYSAAVIANGCTSGYGTTEVVVTSAPSVTVEGNSPVCQGQTFQLTITPGGIAQHTVTGPADFRAVSSTGSISITSVGLQHSGIYTITSTIGTCRVSNTYQLRVKPTPTQPILRAPTWVCTGQELRLEASSNTIVPTYIWQGPMGFHAVAGSSYILIPTSTQQSGVYSVRLVLEGCTSLAGTAAVEIRPTPEAPTLQNDSPKCIGQMVILSASGAPRNSQYFWQGPDGFTTTGASFQRFITSPNQAGLYSAVAILNGCTSMIATTHVQLQQPQYNIPSQLELQKCSGENAVLQVPSLPSGLQYYWSGPANFSSTMASPSLANLQTFHSGIYTLQIIQGKCTTIATQFHLRVLQSPSMPKLQSNSPICTGQLLLLTALNVEEGQEYEWSGPGFFTSSLASPQILTGSPMQSGTYRLKIKNGSCYSPEATIEVEVLPTPSPPVLTPANINICQGQTLQIRAIADVQHTILWNGPQDFTTHGNILTRQNALPEHSGIYFARAISRNCTSAVTYAQVMIRAVPLPQLIENNAPLCAGNTLQIRLAELEGVSYYWQGPQNFRASGSSIHLASILSSQAGIYNVVAITQGCTSQPLPIEVRVLPAPGPIAIQSNAPLCAGNILQLSTQVIGGASYRWSGPNEFESTLLAPSIANVSTLASGIYTLTVSLGNCSSVATQSISIFPVPPSLPRIWSNTPLCQGQTLQFSTIAIEGATYLWQGPQGFTSTLLNPSISNVSTQRSGIYSLVVISGPCTSQPATQAIFIEAVPPIQIQSLPAVCAGEQILLSATPSWEGATYEWRGPLGFITSNLYAEIENAQPPHTGLYRFTARKGNCTVQRNIFISVIQAPQGVKVQSNAPLCRDSALELNVQGPGEYQYEWKGPNNFYLASANGVINPVTTQHIGTYTLTATRSSCRWEIAALPITFAGFLPGTMPLQSNSPICEGDVLTLSAPYVEGANYLWHGPQGFESVAAQAVRPAMQLTYAGIYTLTLQAANCPAETHMIRIEVKRQPPIPQLSSNAPICQNQTLSLSATALPGNATILWSGPNGFSSTQHFVNISNVSTLASGTYHAMSIVEGCTSQVSSLSVNVISLPDAIPSTASLNYCTGATYIDLPLTLIGRGPWQLEGFWENGTPLQTTLGDYNSSFSLHTVWRLSSPRQGTFTITRIADAHCVASKNLPIFVQANNCARETCSAPSQLEVVNITTNSATVRWPIVPSGVVCYILSYTEVGSLESNTLLVPHPSNSFTLTGLVPGKNYQVEIKS
ncbi:MAG: M43 family zinc metalloprotease, partial [Bacteroidia bacterium]|nr:M43 family zinc metalloprotease [Bacteroidia bacterium]